ncbi:MAG: hypothetical protein AAF355_04430 [Myxococcota bacterium]
MKSVTSRLVRSALGVLWVLAGIFQRLRHHADETCLTVTKKGSNLTLIRHLPIGTPPAAPADSKVGNAHIVHPQVLLYHDKVMSRSRFDVGRRTPSPASSLASYLAANGFDVWCLQLRNFAAREALSPKDRTRLRPPLNEPLGDLLTECVRDDLEAALETISLRAGSSAYHFIGDAKGAQVLCAQIAQGSSPSIRSVAVLEPTNSAHRDAATVDRSQASEHLRRSSERHDCKLQLSNPFENTGRHSRPSVPILTISGASDLDDRQSKSEIFPKIRDWLLHNERSSSKSSRVSVSTSSWSAPRVQPELIRGRAHKSASRSNSSVPPACAAARAALNDPAAMPRWKSEAPPPPLPARSRTDAGIA